MKTESNVSHGTAAYSSWQCASKRALGTVWSGLLDLVYPPKCLVCQEMQAKYLCDACLAEIVMIEPPVCARCGGILWDGRCRECPGIDYAFNSARSIGVYDDVLKHAIHRFKYSGHRLLGPVLGQIMVDHLRSRLDFVRRVGCIVPIPIHPSRMRSRGFNQSELLAREIGRAFAVPVLANALARTIPTRPQVDLPVNKRRENVEGAFEVVRADSIAGRSVLLVDDVFTTGSTADAAARALRDAGADEIHVLTLARSV